MKRTGKRMLSWLMALVMCMTMLPATALAEGDVTYDYHPDSNKTATVEGSTAEPEGKIPDGSYWTGPVKSANTSCGLTEHTHTDMCYYTQNVYVQYVNDAGCKHWIDDARAHASECVTKVPTEKCTHSGWGLLSCPGTMDVDGTKYHYDATINCSHEHSTDLSGTTKCYIKGDSAGALCPVLLTANIGKEHAHTEPVCYEYTWTLAWKTFTVTWKWNYVEEGEVKEATQEDEGVTYNTAPTVPSNVPTTYVVGNTTYTFIGWDADNDGKKEESIPAITGETTIKAVYTSETAYTVTFDPNDGIFTDDLAVGAVEGTTVSEPSVPTKDGYTFLGWFDASGAEYDFDTPVTADITLIAKWAENNKVMPGTIGDATVAVNESTLSAEGVSVNAYADVEVEAVRVGANKYISAVEVENATVTDESNVGTSASVKFSAGEGETYTVNVTTADAIVLSGNAINYISGMTTDAEAEELIRELITSVAGVPFAEGTTAMIKYRGVLSFVPLSDSSSGILGVGAYDFGDAESEEIQITCGDYVWEGDIYLKDNRIQTTVTGNDVTVTYGEFTNESLMEKIAPVVSANGSEIGAPAVVFADGKDIASYNAGEYNVTIEYPGSKDYARSTADVTVTIEKAYAEITVDSATAKYGTEVNASSLINSGKADRIEVAVGLSLGDDASADAGVTTYVNIPAIIDVDEIENDIVKGLVEKALSGLNSGNSMSISGLKTALETVLTGQETLESWGVDLGLNTESVEMLLTVLEQIEDLEGVGDLTIYVTMGEELVLKDAGLYLVGGVISDVNYYGYFGLNYVVITPDGNKVDIAFNQDDMNIEGLITLDNAKSFDFGAHAAKVYDDDSTDEATKRIYNLFIYVDADEEIKLLNTDAAAEDAPIAAGAYTQIAYIRDLGNKMYYGEPIIRSYMIMADLVEVRFEDNNPDRQFTFDNQPHAMKATAYKRGTDIELGEAKLTYIGVEGNTTPYYSNTAPVHTGVYTVLATYVNEDHTMFGSALGVMAIKPTSSTIDVTGGKVQYDGQGYTATVEAASTVQDLTPDYTLISGGATVSGDISDVGLDALHGNVNIDFPRWLDEILVKNEFFVEGVDTAYLIDFVSSYRDDLVALIPDEVEGDADQLDAYIDELLTVLAKLPADVNLTFADDVTYTEPGYYFYYGIVTDSDHMPATDTGLLHIYKQLHDFDLLDTTVPYDGEEHWVNMVNTQNADYLAMIVNREDNTVNFLLDDDLMALLEAQPITLPESIKVYLKGGELAAGAMSDLIDALMAQANALDLSEDVVKVLETMKAELTLPLPSQGTITINGAKPVNAGTYECYAISFSEYYQLEVSEGTLTIAPIYVVVDDQAASKVYGEANPALTASVSYYSYDNNGKVAITELPEDINLAYTVVRVDGKNVGTYPMSVENASIVDSKNYVLEVVEDDTVFTITPAAVTITVANASKNSGAQDPVFTCTVTAGSVVPGDDLGISYSREAGETAGTYAINATAANTNYAVTVVPGTLTITSNGGGGTGGGAGGAAGGAGGGAILDTQNHYSYMVGFADGTLQPYGNVTRGQVATIFFRLLTDEARAKYWSQTNDYSDCSADLWCNNAISTLSNMGIIDGYEDGTFRPYAKITRAQFAKIAVGFFETTKSDYQGYFSDVPANAWFSDYVEAAVNAGLIQGFQDGTYRPNDYITRAQACVIVNRALDRKPDMNYLLGEDKMITWTDCTPSHWFYADMMEATNSHDYEMIRVSGKTVEKWTKKLEQRDWTALEKSWSTANSAPGGDVVR